MADPGERLTLSDLCAGNATVREALDTICGPWSMMVLTALAEGPARYADLKRMVEGINDRMLTLTLKQFVRDGLVVRREVAVPRNGVEYALTELGTEVSTALGGFLRTLIRLSPEVARARRLPTTTRRASATIKRPQVPDRGAGA